MESRQQIGQAGQQLGTRSSSHLHHNISGDLLRFVVRDAALTFVSPRPSAMVSGKVVGVFKARVHHC